MCVCGCVYHTLFSHTDEGGVSPAQDAANLRLPVFGDEPPPGDTSAKAGDVTVVGSGAKSVAPFILGESLPPIPTKLVAKIQKGNFMDMAELLRDNKEADKRRTRDGSASSSAGQQAQNRREVPDILSWIQCFGVYACIMGSGAP